jgi:transketolase
MGERGYFSPITRLEPHAVSTAPAPDVSTAIDQLCINTVRALAMDAVQQAESGHPGTPMALAPLGWLLFTRHIRHNPGDPAWPDRDRFVLSAGHASMFLYSILHLTGYAVTLEDLKQFRQWESKTPGHPEYGYTPGVETTTGPLGQGVGNAVGMAVAEAHLAATFNHEGYDVVDHRTWFICSDGDLMEGVSHEAASFAGHFRLGKLIGFYDDNHITIDGRTEITFTDDVAARFEAYGWHVLHVDDVNDLEALDRAIEAAKAETERPSLVVCRTIIGYGSPNKADSPKAHGEPLGAEEVKLAKQQLGYPSLEPFYVPDEALAEWRKAKERGERLQSEWEDRRRAYARAFPAESADLDRRLAGELPAGWESALPTFTAENGNIASRDASQIVINALAPKIPALVGGSADLAGSNKTTIKGAALFAPEDYTRRNIPYGIREHGMGSIMNGMALHGGLIPFGGTFLIFSDYMRPPIRLAALMHQRVIYVFTHDSIGLGEDGPTHQPVEQLTALRVIPGITVIRPADANETAQAWRSALLHRAGPTALVLSRQKLPLLDRAKLAPAEEAMRGGYILAEAEGGKPAVVIMASGSEVALAVAARETLAKEGIAARVVSMPSLELFGREPESYRERVLPSGVPRLAVEAAHPMSWYKWVGSDGLVLGVDRFGASAPYQRIYTELGVTADAVAGLARKLAAR